MHSCRNVPCEYCTKRARLDCNREDRLTEPSFVNTLNSDSRWLPGNFSPRRETIRLLRVAGLSGVLLCNLYSEDSYWAKMGNQRYLHYDGSDQLDSFGNNDATRLCRTVLTSYRDLLSVSMRLGYGRQLRSCDKIER